MKLGPVAAMYFYVSVQHLKRTLPALRATQHDSKEFRTVLYSLMIVQLPERQAPFGLVELQTSLTINGLLLCTQWGVCVGGGGIL